LLTITRIQDKTRTDCNTLKKCKVKHIEITVLVTNMFTIQLKSENACFQDFKKLYLLILLNVKIHK
jgi:hypothetical protein